MTREPTAGVFLGDRRVGTLGYINGNTWFRYEDREPFHPVLGRAFETDPGRQRTASGSVPEWFANLLPEHGSGLCEIIGRNLGRGNPHGFDVLRYVGADLPGAVRVVPDTKITDLDGVDTPDTDCVHTHPVRFSLAGVQAKFSMRWEGKGLVLPMTGEGGDWIVKLPDRRFPDVPRNEYAMLSWARLVGIDVPEIRLVTGGELSGLPDGLLATDEPVFTVRRFDRPSEGVRVHQEDFAQIRETSVDNKYDRATYAGIARVINELCPQDIDEYVRRLATIVVIGNLDAHLKNWTLRYPDGRSARLSPAYDFVSVTAYPEFRAEELAFAVNGGRVARLVTLRHFQDFAKRARLDPEHVLSIVTGAVTALADTWPQVKRDCPVPHFLVEHMDTRLSTLPLVHAATAR